MNRTRIMNRDDINVHSCNEKGFEKQNHKMNHPLREGINVTTAHKNGHEKGRKLISFHLNHQCSQKRSTMKRNDHLFFNPNAG
jgi:hypothetical protein